MKNQKSRKTGTGLIPKLARHWVLITIVSAVIYVSGNYLSSIVPSSIRIYFVDPFTFAAGVTAVVGVVVGAYERVCTGRVKNDVVDLLINYEERTVTEIKEALRQDSGNWFLCGDLINADWWFRNLLRDMTHLEYSTSPEGEEIYKIKQ